jgi:hypothetical protein
MGSDLNGVGDGEIGLDAISSFNPGETAMGGVLLAAALATQPICMPSGITQPEASQLAAIVAHYQAHWAPKMIILNVDLPGPGDTWYFRARLPGAISSNDATDVGAYKVYRRTAEVQDLRTGDTISIPQLKAAQIRLLKAHCLDAATP